MIELQKKRIGEIKMKLKYLGTAAAEGIPAIFCDCPVCTTARKIKGKNIRTRSQAIIDGKLLIDFPPDTYMHSLNYDIDLTKVRECLITHTHADHLYEDELIMRYPGFGSLTKGEVMNFYGLHGAMMTIRKKTCGYTVNAEEFVDTNTMELYKKTKVGDYTVTALKAIHGVETFPAIYLIEDKEGKSVLYGNDTHYFCEEVWEYLEKNPVKLSFVSLDCTAANRPEMNYVGHMCLNDNIRVKERLIKIGCADENTIFCSNHFSHNGENVLYEEFSEIAKKAGFLTSYDGMEIEF